MRCVTVKTNAFKNHILPVLIAAIILAIGITLLIIYLNNEKEENKATAQLSFHSYDGGGPQYGISIDDPDIISFTSEKVYSDKNHAQKDGSGYDLIYTFKSLKAGKTIIRVATDLSNSKIPDRYYSAAVGDDMSLTIEEMNDVSDENSFSIAPVGVLVFECDHTTLYAPLIQSSASLQFSDKLSEGIVSLDFNKNELGVCGPLGFKISVSDESSSFSTGDVVISSDGNITIVSRDKNGNGEKIAKIEGISETVIKDFFGQEAPVSMYIEWSE